MFGALKEDLGFFSFLSYPSMFKYLEMHFYDPFNKQPTRAKTGALVADEQAGFSLL